jgi:DNA-binding MarR family transcriptional regulator
MSRSDNPGTSETDPADLLIRLLKLSSFVSGPMRDGVCDPAGIAPAELRIVMALAGEGALAGHDLVEITGLQPMNVSRAMAQLRGRGWIEDARDPDNRRRKPVVLSAAGRAAYAKTLPDFEVVASTLLGGLSLSERNKLATLSDKVNERLIDWIRSHHAEVKL